MKVERLVARSFRNLEAVELYPDAHLNFISGDNGQGKTSILEALGYLATLRSFRGAKSRDVTRIGDSTGQVEADIILPQDESWRVKLSVRFEGNKKIASIDGKPYPSSASYLAKRFGNHEIGFHTIIFNPGDHDLVKGDPGIRRAYLDAVCGAENPEYWAWLSRYKKAVEQKNALLRLKKDQHDFPTYPQKELLFVLNDQIKREGSKITFARLNWLKKVETELPNRIQRIAPNQKPNHILWLSSWGAKINNYSYNNKELDSFNFSLHSPIPSLELIDQLIAQKQASLFEAECKTGHTLVGPHRDDWLFLLGENTLAEMGSQGEIRASLLALKLTELEVFKNTTGHMPIFLLDDFSSELDRTRRMLLLNELFEKKLQVFVTSTEDTFLKGKRFVVKNGSIIKNNGIQSPSFDGLFSG